MPQCPQSRLRIENSHPNLPELRHRGQSFFRHRSLHSCQSLTLTVRWNSIVTDSERVILFFEEDLQFSQGRVRRDHRVCMRATSVESCHMFGNWVLLRTNISISALNITRTYNPDPSRFPLGFQGFHIEISQRFPFVCENSVTRVSVLKSKTKLRNVTGCKRSLGHTPCR